MRAAGLILIGNGLSRLLGLIRIQVIAALFGATAATSAFQTASAVPTMVYDLVVGGAISAALIPVLTEYARREDPRDLGRIAGGLMTLGAICLTAIALLLGAAAIPLVNILGVSTSHPASFVDETVSMVRLVLPAVIVLGLSGMVTAVLYARQVFGYATYSQAAFNAGIIAAAVLLSPWLGVTSLVVGVVLGSALQLILQVPGLRGIPFDWRPDLTHPGIRRVLSLYWPVALGLLITQIGIAVDRNLAWQTGASSVAVMAFATTLVQLPLGLAVTATSFAVLPLLSQAAEDRDDEAFRSLVGLGVRLSLLAVLPAMVGLVATSELVVRVLFERGVFDRLATEQTARAFIVYAPQMPFWAIDQVLIFAFYARKQTGTPVLVGIGGVGIFVVTALALVEPFGVYGLVAANSIQNILHALVMLLLGWRAFGGLTSSGLWASLARLGLASVTMAVVMLAVGHLAIGLRPGPSATGDLLRLAALAIVGGLVYVAVLIATGAAELREVRRRFPFGGFRSTG